MGETDWGKLGLVLVGEAMLSKSLSQFSVNGWDCVPSLLFCLRPNCQASTRDSWTLTGKSGSVSHWPPKSNSLGLSVPLPSPQVGKSVVDPRTFLTM